MNINIEQLSAFIAVYEHGSFALAAHKLKKHASTLSKRVNNLELDLGFDLFERHAAALTPNKRADELYLYAKAVEFEMDQFNYRTLNILEGLPSKLTIGIDHSILGLGITSAITSLAQSFPALELVMVEGNTLECVQRTRSGETDIAIVLSTEHYGLEFAQIKLKPFQAVSVTSREYAKQFGIEPGGAIGHQTRRQMKQIILHSFGELGHDQVQQASHHYYRVSGFPCALDLICNGLGWGNQPRAQCQHLIDSGELIEFHAEHEAEYRWSADAIWLASNPLSAPLKLLLKALTEV